ncbi:hypothetical protein BpHYR1_038525 [Brachionus plicatilis]|uniref:Uncharacterized protein n=1 Tax=Brachionus plicatilis TaxID=10195 RepID=A0A3M7Q172_BRAPC|nr:hypothetical protein BpHYR1_038525 [Brachionus plicatilis]
MDPIVWHDVQKTGLIINFLDLLISIDKTRQLLFFSLFTIGNTKREALIDYKVKNTENCLIVKIVWFGNILITLSFSSCNSKNKCYYKYKQCYYDT